VTGSIAGQSIDAEPELERLVQLTAGLLEEMDERLQPGDRIITGSLVTPFPASPGDSLSLELEHLGSVSVSITD
jgi:2-keto-4-pentenoate hydratase